MTTAVLGGVPFADGALQIQVRPSTGVPSSEPRNGGWAIASTANAAYVEDAGAAVPATAVTLGGLAFTPDGALYITQSTTGTFADIGGHKVRSDGALLVKGGTPTIGTDPFISGWAHDGPTRAAYIDGSFVLPLADLGAGAVNTALLVGTGSATFTRATAAASKLSTGLWKLDVASGTARSSYLGLDTTVGAYGGYLAEGARTNSCLQSRDITNASWTKTTLTTAKTSTGIDGVGSSCTRCTASAGNGNAVQAITLASAAKTFSVWIKRVTGTGTVQISLDNFATNTDVTALINSVTFTLVQMTQTLANPTVGIRLVTNADAIDVDIAQLEDGASFASTPIPTTVAAVSRNSDDLNYPSAGNTGSSGTLYAEIAPYQVSVGTGGVLNLRTDVNNRLDISRTNVAATGRLSATDASVTQASMSTANSMTAGAVSKLAGSYAANSYSVCLNGGTVVNDSAGTIPAFTTIQIANVENNQLFGGIKNVRVSTRQPLDSVLQSITT